MKELSHDAWPLFDYAQFKSTGYLLHMGLQVIGKLKLHTPFEPHWSNVVLPITSRGLTTGIIPYHSGAFSVDMDMIDHHVVVTTSSGLRNQFQLEPMSVAQFTKSLFNILRQFNIDITINFLPQEITNPITFDQDTKLQSYDKALANAWWRILLSSYLVMMRYHSRFNGETPPIGLMWGTFDLRDARYNGKSVPTTGQNAGYIRRNAMNEAQVEVGFWPGNEAYPKPAYFSFVYPQPQGIERAKIKPEQAHWDPALMEFVLDYDDLRKSPHPEKNLLDFFESTYKAGTELAGWNPELMTTGEPV